MRARLSLLALLITAAALVPSEPTVRAIDRVPRREAGLPTAGEPYRTVLIDGERVYVAWVGVDGRRRFCDTSLSAFRVQAAMMRNGEE